MKYAFSGQNDTLLDATEDATGVDAGDPTTLLAGRYLIGRPVTTGRVAWLRWVTLYDASGAATVRLFDATAGTNPTAASLKAQIRCASSPGATAIAGQGGTTRIEWPAPGLKFTTGICISKETTDASASFQVGHVAGGGYEE